MNRYRYTGVHIPLLGSAVPDSNQTPFVYEFEVEDDGRARWCADQYGRNRDPIIKDTLHRVEADVFVPIGLK